MSFQNPRRPHLLAVPVGDAVEHEPVGHVKARLGGQVEVPDMELNEYPGLGPGRELVGLVFRNGGGLCRAHGDRALVGAGPRPPRDAHPHPHGARRRRLHSSGDELELVHKRVGKERRRHPLLVAGTLVGGRRLYGDVLGIQALDARGRYPRAARPDEVRRLRVERVHPEPLSPDAYLKTLDLAPGGLYLYRPRRALGRRVIGKDPRHRPLRPHLYSRLRHRRSRNKCVVYMSNRGHMKTGILHCGPLPRHGIGTWPIKWNRRGYSFQPSFAFHWLPL